METDTERHKLFVYGTLKKKHRLNSLLVDEVFVGDYITKNSSYGMSSYLDSFPMVYYSDTHSSQIIGELYELTTLNYEQILAMEYNAGFIPIQVDIQEIDNLTDERALMFLIPNTNGVDKDMNYYQKQNSKIKMEDNKMEWVNVW